MLHKLSLDASSTAVSNWQQQKKVYTNLRANLAMAWPLNLIVFLVNHWRDIINCSCKWLCFLYS